MKLPKYVYKLMFRVNILKWHRKMCDLNSSRISLLRAALLRDCMMFNKQIRKERNLNSLKLLNRNFEQCIQTRLWNCIFWQISTTRHKIFHSLHLENNYNQKIRTSLPHMFIVAIHLFMHISISWKKYIFMFFHKEKMHIFSNRTYICKNTLTKHDTW